MLNSIVSSQDFTNKDIIKKNIHTEMRNTKLGKRKTEKKQKIGFLGTIERVGNALPHPFILFLIITGLLVVLAAVLAACGIQVTKPTTDEVVAVKSLLNKDGFAWIMTNMVGNFSSFAALGVVLAMQMAIGVAEGRGLLTTAMRRAILGVPTWLLTAVVVFFGINGSIASEASIIFIPPLAATAFLAAGKHPVAGLMAGYAAVNVGFTANVMITATDALLYPVTEEIARIIDSLNHALVSTKVQNMTKNVMQWSLKIKVFATQVSLV